MGSKQTEAAFTPGPWKTEVLGHSLRVTKAEHEYDNDDIARIGDCHDATAQANAHLIAAAPELFNALSVLADAAEACGIPVDAARAALARARGDA